MIGARCDAVINGNEACKSSRTLEFYVRCCFRGAWGFRQYVECLISTYSFLFFLFLFLFFVFERRLLWDSRLIFL